MSSRGKNSAKSDVAGKVAAIESAALGSAVAEKVAALETRVHQIEKSSRKDKLFLLLKQKKALLNFQMKSYSNNFIVKGIKFAVKDVQGEEEKEE